MSNPIDDILGAPESNPVDNALGVPKKEIPLTERAQTAWRGAAQGLTSGAIQYPQAMLMALIDSGKYKNLQELNKAYKESLADLRKQNEQLAKDDPYAWYGGNVAGGVVQGVATGGGSIPMQIGKLAASGAVSGFTKDEKLKDTLIGAGTGVAVGSLGAGATKLASNAENAYLKVATEPIIPKLSSGQKITPTQSQALHEQALKDFSLKGIAGRTASAIGNEIKSAVIPAGIGAVGGATLAGLHGQDPVMGAKYGAAGTVAATKIKVLRDLAKSTEEIAGLGITKFPNMVPNTLAGISVPATQAATQGFADVANRPEPENPIDSILGMPPLRQLANDFKKRNGLTSGALRRNAYVPQSDEPQGTW